MSALRYVPVVGALISSAGVALQLDAQRQVLLPLREEVQALRNEVRTLKGAPPLPAPEPVMGPAQRLHARLRAQFKDLVDWLPVAQR